MDPTVHRPANIVIGWAWRRSIMLSKGTTVRHFSPCAGLAALGVKLRALDIFGPIRERVRIEMLALREVFSTVAS
jgi:hypothetical protein